MKSDLLDIMLKTASGKLREAKLEWYAGAAVCVVMASKGYPGDYKKGFTISGIEDAQREINTTVFHAGTTIKNKKYCNIRRTCAWHYFESRDY